MAKNINIVPAQKIEAAAGIEEVKTALCNVEAAFADETCSQDGAQLMQVKHIRRRVIELRVGEFIGSPIAALLLFGQIDTEEFLANILEPMTVCVGPHEAGRDFRAKDVMRVDAEVALHDGDVKTAKMENLGHVRIDDQGFEVWRIISLSVHLHDMRVAVAG